MKYLPVSLILLASPSAQAECADVLYAIAGTVIAAEDSSPVSGALVAVAWNDTVQGATLERTAHTDSSGRYSIDVPFYPWAGNVHGTDLCSAKLTEVVVLVAAPDFVEQQGSQSVTSTATTANYSLKRTAGVGLR